MSTVPASSKLPRAAWPRAIPEFTFSVRSHGGRPIGPGLEEFDWTLEVSSRSALASLEYHRSDADMPGTPIGIFRRALSDDELKSLRQKVLAARLDSIDATLQGHPGYTESAYRYAEANHPTLQVVINNSHHRALSEIADLAGAVNALMAALLAEGAERAVRAHLEHVATAPVEQLVISIQNVGIEPVCLQDPRSVVADGPLHQAQVQMTDFVMPPPGTPASNLQWRALAIVPAPQAASPPPLVVLAPGETWTHAMALERDPTHQYLAYFTLANGAAPRTRHDAYCIRGRVDSNRVLIAPR